jgi:tetratricopeptide (TPR) repeat protein
MNLQRPLLFSATLLLVFVSTPNYSLGQGYDPFDPFSFSAENTTDIADEDKSLEDLLRESLSLQGQDLVLEARSKLLVALKKYPKDFRPYFLLSDYYLSHADHFRLALKYARQSLRVFEAEKGKPPYLNDYEAKTWHGDILGMISQARLNSDDYTGALDELNEFEKLGYAAPWFHSSKAWVLMKLHRLDEAIAVAKEGTRSIMSPASSLNVLAILLSMTGERQASLEVFEKALNYELAQGSNGHPATPLNNVGEVYKEIFRDTLAKNSWERALRMPDACEHILPSVNLVMLLIDQVQLSEASTVLDNFDSCVAQYPLRNGEEHKALEELMRARIALHKGDIAKAFTHCNEALERTQWFGKIGTSPEDMKAAAFATMAQILAARNAELATTVTSSYMEEFNNSRERISNSVRHWWMLRKARNTLITKLDSFEDMFIRHTDSMLEYPTLGDIAEGVSPRTLRLFLETDLKNDSRSGSKAFYKAYEAQSLHAFGEKRAALSAYSEALSLARPKEDVLLQAHLHLMRAKLLGAESKSSEGDIIAAFRIAPALVRNYGLPLPVQSNTPDLIKGSAFRVVSDSSTPFEVSLTKSASSKEVFTFRDRDKGSAGIPSEGDDAAAALNALMRKVFVG